MPDSSCEDIEINIVKSPRHQHFHVEWAGGKKRPLIPVRHEAQLCSIQPGREFHTFSELQRHRYLIIFCERGGGGRTFLEWWRAGLDKAKCSWLYADGTGMGGNVVDLSTSADKDEPDDEKPDEENTDENDQAQAKARSFMEALSKAEDVNRKAEVLKQWARARPETEPLYLIFRDLGGAGKEASALAGALRLVAESQEGVVRKAFRVLIISTSESSFQNSEQFSNFEPMTVQYRLPFLDSAEIGKLSERVVGKALTGFLDNDDRDADALFECLGREIQKQVGGQVRLTQELLRILKRDHAETFVRLLSKGTDTDVFEARVVRKVAAAAEILKKALPTQPTESWKQDLRQLLQEKQGLQERLRSYFQGERLASDMEPPAAERSLWLGGWTQFDASGRWGITSPLHAHIALQVLDELRAASLRPTENKGKGA